MNKLNVEQYPVGMIGTNCYFAVNTETKEMFVVDPGGDAGMLIGKIKEKGYSPKAVLLTHGHYDHANGAREVAENFGIPIYAHEAEKEVLQDPQKNVSGMFGARAVFDADIYINEKTDLKLAGFQIQLFHTPGHTPGGVCYYIAKEKVLFSGDSLFCQSIGRTDFPGGSASSLIRAVKEKLMALPDDVAVYPGHESLTNIGQERKYNPYL